MTITLTPWAGTGVNRAAKFQDPLTGEWYYLQYKAPVGYDAPTALNGNQGVEILKGGLEAGTSLVIAPSTLPFSGYYATNLAWQAGQTFTTAGGSRITVNSVSADSATVTVTGGNVPPPGVADLMDAKAAQFGLGAGFGGYGITRDGGWYHMYQGGSVVWTPASGAMVSRGAIRSVWQSLGFENGKMGYPTTDEIAGLKDGGVYQAYEGGAIVWSPATGAFESKGAIRTDWQSLGFENGKMGYPTSGEASGLTGGGVYQMYQGGAIVWSPATGAHESTGAIRGEWKALGFENGKMGYPTTDKVSGLKNGGVTQSYQGGAIVWSPATGAFESKGAIRAAWEGLGAQDGALGYPTSGEYAVAGGVAQDFQGGRIVWSPTTGITVTQGGGTATPTPSPTPTSTSTAAAATGPVGTPTASPTSTAVPTPVPTTAAPAPTATATATPTPTPTAP